ncbi:MAG: hypothetical protein AAB225_22105, partial [Acidobacteriota bacterium]
MQRISVAKRPQFSGSRRWFGRLLAITAYAALAAVSYAGTFGSVVPIAGHLGDVALDEKRGVVYLANFTGNRVDVLSIEKKTIQNSLNLGALPASLALSADGRYLVVLHYGNFKEPYVPSNLLTVL